MNKKMETVFTLVLLIFGTLWKLSIYLVKAKPYLAEKMVSLVYKMERLVK